MIHIGFHCSKKEPHYIYGNMRNDVRNVSMYMYVVLCSPGTDLTALIQLGYNIADRDANNQTPRDIAAAHNITDNISAIGMPLQFALHRKCGIYM